MAKGFIADFLVRVGSIGLGKAKKDVDDLANSTDRLTTAHRKAALAAGDHFNTTEKGIIGTANSTKNFSKLAQGMNSSSGIVGAYATLAANVFAVTAAFGALRRAAQVEQVQSGLEALGNRMGLTLSRAAKDVQEISGYTVSAEQAMRSTAQIMTAGLPRKAVNDLTTVARDASFALGRNMTDSMDRLTRGVVKLEPELLDELGLMTKLTEATTAYANSHNKTEAQLTRVEKQQAFLNAIVAEGTAKFGGLAEEAGNTRAFDELSASFANLVQSGLSMINVVLLPLANILSNRGVLAAGMILFASTLKKQLLPGLANMAAGAQKTAEAVKEMAIEQAHAVSESGEATNKYFKTYVNRVEAGKNASIAFAKANKQLSQDIIQMNDDIRNTPSATDRGTIATMRAEAQEELQTLRTIEAARIRANRAEAEAGAIGAASQGRLREGWKGVKTAVGLYAAEVAVATTGTTKLGKTTQANLIRIRAGFYGAALAARVFGAALLNAIPIIGQLILVASILWEGFEKLRDWWQGPAIRNFNKALEDQVEILNHVAGTVDQVNRVAQQQISIAQKEQLIYSAIGNSVNENVDAYLTAAKARDQAFPDTGKFRVEDTPEYKTILVLKAYPQALNQIKAGLRRKGVDETILDKPDAMITVDDLHKIGQVLNNDLRNGVVALGAAITDLKDGYTATAKAVNEFNKSAIPNTAYDQTVSALDSVAASIYEILKASAQTGDTVDRMTGALVSAPKELRNFFPPDLQAQIKEFEQLEANIRAAGDKATQADRDRYHSLQQILAVRSSEVFEVRKMFVEAQSLQRITAAQIQLEQARLNKLNSFTALSAQDVVRRRNAENHIIQLQAQQIKSQQTIIALQIQQQENELAINKAKLAGYEINVGLIQQQEQMNGLSQAKVVQESTVAIANIQREIKEAQDRGADKDELDKLDRQLKLWTDLASTMGVVNAQQSAIREMQAQNTALGKQVAAQLATQTSQAVIAAEAEATAASARNDTQELANRIDQESLNLADKRVDLATRELGRVRDLAGEYNDLMRTQAVQSKIQKTSLASQNAATIAQIKLERQRAVEQGATETVAILDNRLDLQNKLLAVQLEEIDVENRRQVLEKFGFDTQSAGLKMQQESLDYAQKYLDTIRDTAGIQKDLEDTQRALDRRRSGRAENVYDQMADEIRTAKLKYEETVREAGVRKATITLEFALLEAQRQQAILNMEAQRTIVGASTEMGQQLTAIINNMKAADGLVVQARDAALEGVDKSIEAARAAYQLAATPDRGHDSIGSILRARKEYLELQRQAQIDTANAAKTAIKPETHLSPLVTTQQDLIKVTTDLVEVNRQIVEQTAKTPAATGGITTLQQAAAYGAAHGFRISEMAGFGGVSAGVHRGAGHREGRAFDLNIGTGNREWSDPVMKRKMDALADYYRGLGFKVLWGIKGHFDHMHVEIPRGVQAVAAQTAQALVTTVSEPAKAAVQAITQIQDQTDDLQGTTGSPIYVTANKLPQPSVKPPQMGVVQDTLETFKDISTAGPLSILTVFQEMADKLGPEGQIVPSIIEGINTIGDAYLHLRDVLSDPDSSFADRFEGYAAVAISAINTVSAVLQSSTDAKVANIDREIAAEQKRDGKSAESIAKIQSLERKKDAIQRKAFNADKKLKMASAIIATATGVAQALSYGPIVGPILAAIIAALGAAQLAIIAGTSYQSTSAPAMEHATPSALTIGKQGDQVDLARNNVNAGGEIGYLRGVRGRGTNASDFAVIGSAYGGPLPRGYRTGRFVVGEKGPETIEPQFPITVRPADRGDTVNTPLPPVHIDIRALDAKGVEEVLYGQRGNIIGMLREAANASGQRFLEDVNINVYTKPNVTRL